MIVTWYKRHSVVDSLPRSVLQATVPDVRWSKTETGSGTGQGIPDMICRTLDMDKNTNIGHGGRHEIGTDTRNEAGHRTWSMGHGIWIG